MTVRRGKTTSKSVARKLIFTMARFGNHGYASIDNHTSDADIRSAFENAGFDLDKVIERVMSPEFIIHFFENAVRSTLFTIGNASISRPDGSDMISVTGHSRVTLEPYWGAYEESVKLLDVAVETFSVEKVLAASQRAVASVDAFISERAREWNLSNPQDQLLDDGSNKVSFDKKIDEWIPKMTGQKLDKSGRNWCDFWKLKYFRDKMATHQTGAPRGVSEGQLCENANLFQCGVAGLLFDLHRLFKKRVPSAIIRGAYAPPFFFER
jgi:hypothetical protein